jgi:rare lipoprotein A
LGLTALCAAQTQQSSGGAGFRQEGIASWYGTEFDGRPTASGEIFNAALFTAAHPTLPFGTVLTVTNQHNNKQVSVRVNDRGPFVSARIIDLSRAAAEQLDMLVTGTAPVIIEGIAAGSPGAPQFAAETSSSAISEGGWSSSSSQIITPLPYSAPEQIVIQQSQQQIQQSQPVQQVQPIQQVQPVQQVQQPPPVVQQYQQVQQPVQPVQQIQQVQPVQPPPPLPSPPVQIVVVPLPAETKGIPAPAPNRVYRIQVGSYKMPKNAVETFEKLKKAGLSPVYERSGEYFRVVLSGVRSEDVESVTRRIGAAGFKDPLLREE